MSEDRPSTPPTGEPSAAPAKVIQSYNVPPGMTTDEARDAALAVAEEARALRDDGCTVSDAVADLARGAGRAFDRPSLENLIRMAYSGDGIGTTRDGALKMLSENLGVEIRSVTKRGAVDGVLELELADGFRTVTLGTVKEVLSRAHVRARIADVLGRIPRLPSGKKYDPWVQNLLDAAYVVNLETARDEELIDWLDKYAGRAHVVDDWSSTNLANQIKNRQPFVRDGELHIHVGTFHHFVRVDGNRLALAEMRARLHRAGFTAGRVVAARVGANVHKASYWAVPMSRLFPDLYIGEMDLDSDPEQPEHGNKAADTAFGRPRDWNNAGTRGTSSPEVDAPIAPRSP